MEKYKKSKAGALIYESESVQEKILIDLKVDKVITNSKKELPCPINKIKLFHPSQISYSRLFLKHH